MISKEQLIEKLRDLGARAKDWEVRETDESPESAHVQADNALLEYIGDNRVKSAFKSIEKWYA